MGAFACMDNSKGPGPDGIPTKVYKELADEISLQLSIFKMVSKVVLRPHKELLDQPYLQIKTRIDAVEIENH